MKQKHIICFANNKHTTKKNNSDSNHHSGKYQRE